MELNKIAIIVDKNLTYYKNLKEFLDYYGQELTYDSFITKAIKTSKVNSNLHYYKIILAGSDNSYWIGNQYTNKKPYHLYRDYNELHEIFKKSTGIDASNDNNLTQKEIAELKNAVWIKLNNETEIQNIHNLLIKYNQPIYVAKDNIELMIGNKFISNGYLGLNGLKQFGIWGDLVTLKNQNEEIIKEYGIVINTVELLEYLFKQEQLIINK